MSIKHHLHHSYRKVKYSNLWQTNRVMRSIQPIFGLLVISLVFGYKKIYSPIRRSGPSRALRYAKNKTWGKLKAQDLNSNLFKLARLHGRAERWKAASRTFSLGLAREQKRKRPRSEYLNEAKFNLSVINRIIEIDAYKQHIANYRQTSKNPRIAIFTAIAGGYDTIKLPEVLMPKADYFLFTDQSVPDTGVFKIKPLPYFHIDTPRMTRYVKTHPHQLLADYDIAIWVDANILMTGDISDMILEFKKSNKAVGAVPHPLRKTIYEEAKACIVYNKEDKRLLNEQVEHYRALKYNTNELIESNILMFDLKSAKLADFLTTWWSEIDKYTRRDQLSLNYSLDKNKIEWHKIMERKQDARNHPLFSLVPHSVRQKGILVLNELLSKKTIDPFTGTSFAEIKEKVITSNQDRHIDVVYCVHNALDDVKICLGSVLKNRKSQNVKLIIIDDGSDSPTADYLQKFRQDHRQWVKLARNEAASGYTKAANQGLKMSTGELAILLNSDTIVTGGWTEKMAEAVFSTPGAGVVGPLSSAASHQSIPNHIGSGTQTATNELPKGLDPEGLNKHCEQWSVAGYYPYVPLAHGFCFGITREVINKVGYFDEESFPYGYGEENDYCFRVTDAGFVLVIATNVYIFHAKSKSYQDDRRIKLMKQGNEKLAQLKGKDRIARSIKSVLANPTLQQFRDNTLDLYKKFHSTK